MCLFNACGKSSQEKHLDNLHNAQNDLHEEQRQLDRQKREYDQLQDDINDIREKQDRLNN